MKALLVILLSCLAGSAKAQDTTKPKMKEYLGVLTLVEKYKSEQNWTPKDQQVVGEHFQRLLNMKKEGIVVLAGRTQYPENHKDMMGLVIFYAPNDKAAEEFMQNDPAVKSNIMLAKVHPYGIAIKCN